MESEQCSQIISNEDFLENFVIIRGKQIINLPESISPESSNEDCLLYAGIRGATTFINGPGRISGGYVSLAELDQENLLYFVHCYENYVCYNPDLPFDSTDYYVYPAQRNNGVYVYDKQTVSRIIKDVFGVENYVINCSAYNPVTETYTVINYGIGGIPITAYGKDVVWVDDSTYTCKFYWYDILRDEDRNAIYPDIGDWTVEFTITMKKGENGAFYIESIVQKDKS